MTNRKVARPIAARTSKGRPYRPRELKVVWMYLKLHLNIPGAGNADYSIELPPRDPSTDVWSWPGDGEPQTEADRRTLFCGKLLSIIAAWLPLERTPSETLYAFLVDGELVIDIIDLSNDALVYRMNFPADVERFSQSRDRLRRLSTWDKARNRRLVRVDGSGGRYILEPGVNIFVEWLETHGATTFFSCEGHPGDFYLVFATNPKLAHRLALPGVLYVTPITSRVIDLPAGDMVGPDGTGLWGGYMCRSITDYDDLNATLRALANHWNEVGRLLDLSTGDIDAIDNLNPCTVGRSSGLLLAELLPVLSTITQFDGVAVADFDGLPASASRWL